MYLKSFEMLCWGGWRRAVLHRVKEERNLQSAINPLNAELNPIRHLLALVGDRHIVHVSRMRVKKKEG